MAAASGGLTRIEGDARLEPVLDDMKCSTKFLDADDKRLASGSAMVDEANVVVFGPQESYIGNTSTVRRIPMVKRKGVFVVQLDAQTGPRIARTVKFEPEFGFSGAQREPKCGRTS